MLDLSGIPVVDNHCHPIVRQQQLDTLQFRRYFTEATSPEIAHMHLPHTVYYRWILRQLATFYGCEPTEEAVLAMRAGMSADTLLQRFIQAAHIDTLILDIGHPLPAESYTPEQISQVGQCRTARMLRLETLMQDLVMAYSNFDEVIERFTAAVSDVRAAGYCALKSIVAYRTGLEIREWSKDEAAEAFMQAHTEGKRMGYLRIAQKPLIDYLLHIAFRKAAEQQLPIQFHTGYGDSDTDMRLGNPLHLRAIFERSEYRTMQIVLLHESYPYSQLGAYLATVYPHVYFDLSYTIPFLDKLEMLAFTRQALSIAPASKLLYSSDSIHVPEMYWAGALRGRDVIAQVLQEMIAVDEIDQQDAYLFARLILRENAYTLYRL